MTNQDRAQDIATKLHEVERLQRELKRATKALHDAFNRHACECGPAIGIDPAPLSAGGSK